LPNAIRQGAPRRATDAGAPLRGDPRLLGRILVDDGVLSESDLEHALEQQRRIDARLGDILVAEELVTPRDLRQALARQHGMAVADLDGNPPKEELRTIVDPELCLKHLVVPWRYFGEILLVATSHPERFDAFAKEWSHGKLAVLPVLAEDNAIRSHIERLHGRTLAVRAETRAPREMSCRTWDRGTLWRAIAAGALAALLLGAAIAAPATVAATLGWLAIVTLALSMLVKLAAGGAQLAAELKAARHPPTRNVTPIRLPHVSVMVPLLREREIADALIRRLSRLTYPKALLDVVLVLEESDTVTRKTLERTALPPWMRVVEVPLGSGLMTKPRALNYALDFCRGSIVGIWDAEDAPDPRQLEEVVTRFHEAPPEVVCLQGRLDYYNSRANWIARCFTIEYAAWWRLVMPGLARLGMVIPLGGTTLFFRRKELEELGGWDAHNVTEDADLGLRLARAGYRTELIDTVTHEEANCRAWPWIRQRSRWLKGFAITWAVHMRNPVRLWRDLGTYRFLGVQLFYTAALSQFLLAPVFWAFWLLTFGEVFGVATAGTLPGVAAFFILCELATLGLHAAAVRRPAHRHLLIWTPTMMLYFPMACIAMYKALYELVGRPFFWDKTRHGVSPRVDSLPYGPGRRGLPAARTLTSSAPRRTLPAVKSKR
jgi:cellulose synthase/poly-beta-1,6-N-acetylglucosamine synthase-like glycosyltransferase